MVSPTRVLVIGGYGFLGATIATAFAQAGWHVSRGSRSPHTNGATHVNLDEPDTVRRAAATMDVVVNTVPDTDFVAEKAVLRDGGLMLNVATLDQRPLRDLRDHAAQQSLPGTVVVNAGLAPGITNLVICDLLRKYPQADAVEIVMALQTTGMSGKYGVHFVHENLVTATKDGARVRYHATSRIPLPQPFGTRTCFSFAESQDGWLLGAAGNRALHTYGYIDNPALHNAILALNTLRLLPLLPRTPLQWGHRTKPDDETTEPVAHWLAVLHRGSRIAARTVRCCGDYRRTAAATLVTAEALLSSHGSRAGGCFGIEEVLALNQIENRLRDNGITIDDELEAEPFPRPIGEHG